MNYREEIVVKLQEIIAEFMLEDISMSEFQARVAKVERLAERTIERS